MILADAPSWVGPWIVPASISSLIVALVALYRARRDVRDASVTEAAKLWGQLVQELRASVVHCEDRMTRLEVANEAKDKRIDELEYALAVKALHAEGGKRARRRT